MIDEQLYDTAIDELIEAHVRITNLEMITQALADELMLKDRDIKFLLDRRNALADELRAQNDYIDDLIVEYVHALDMAADREDGSLTWPGWGGK